MGDPLAELREEIAELRRRLDRLTLPSPESGSSSATPGSPGTLAVQAPDGTTPIQLRAEEGRAGLYFYDKGGACRVLIEVTERGGTFSLVGPEGHAVVTAKAIDGHGQVTVSSPDGVGRAAIRSTKQ